MEWRLVAIFLANFLCCLTYDVIAPFYPVEAHHLGLSHFDTGLVFTSMPLAGFIASPFIGSCLYRLGRRNTFTGGILLMVKTIKGVSMGLMAMADLFPVNIFFAVSLAARAVAGVGTGCVYTVCKSYIAYAYVASDYPEQMNELIALTETFSGFGLVAGPAIGAGLYVFAGYEGVFLGLGALFLAGSVLIHCLLHSDKPYIIAESESHSLLTLAVKYPILINCLPVLFSMIAIGFCDTVMGPHFETFSLSPLEVGFLWAIADSGYLVVSLVLAKTLDYVNLRGVNLAGIGIVAIAYWMLGPWDVVMPRMLGLVVIGLGLISVAIAAHYIAALPNLIQVAEEELHFTKDDLLIDALSALVASSTFLGEVLGPVLAGYLADLYGVEFSGGIFGIAEAIIGLLYLLYFWKYWNSRDKLEVMKLKEGLLVIST